jgi:hypothetical protein
MTAGLRLTITALPVALAAALSAAPLPAQNAVQQAPPSNDTIGPSELRDFSLEGQGTRAAPPPTVPPPSLPQPTTSAPPPRAATALPPPSASSTPTPGSTGSNAQPQRPAPRAPSPNPSSSSSVTFSLPSADADPSSPVGTADAPSALGSQPSLAPLTPPESASIPIDSGRPMWPWLLAAMLAGLGILYYAMRQRARPAHAGPANAFDSPPPSDRGRLERAAATPRATPPAPVPARPAAALPPKPPVSSTLPGMIVSTALRPRLDIQFMPERLIIDNERATIQFAASVFNSGNAPARDVLVEAAMFNAGATQDEEIGAFFAHPVGRGERIAELLPLKSINLRSEVVLPTRSLRVFDVEGRKLFVPLIGFNALYGWSGKEAQTSESFIVGVDTKGDRMGPFRVDTGPRQFRNIAARPHSVRVRK